MRARRLVSLLAIFLVAEAAVGAAERDESIRDYAGHWISIEPQTRYITRIDIEPQKASADTVRLHVWSKCQPRDCDWGTTSGELRKGKLLAVWQHGNGTIKHEFTIETGSRLKLRAEAKFADRAGRQAQHSVSYFVRERSNP